MLRLNSVALILLALAAGFVHADCDEVGYIATFDVKPGSEQAFEQAILQLASKVVEMEDGVVLYAPFRGDDGRYYMMERYRNLQAREVHGSAEEVQALFPALLEPLAGPASVESVTAVCAPTE